jgi:hypothetical protein
MNETADYARLKQAYFNLLELAPEAREPRLVELEATDAALAAALRRQLRAAAVQLPMLDRAAATPAVPELPNYRLLHELGRGGMGVVWLAERALDDARQHVALKQIAHGHWSEEDLRRFQRERRILASLDHPGIAALVDGGTDARGVAYIATQYIQGERLDRWCEAQRLDARRRVQLLAQVVAAVAHAHARLVVHRDLKPANILVTREGAPKLLDFGIARALQEDAVTTEGPSQMTLRYAAPEQIESQGADAGVSVDVYALGVLLYELLARASPYGEPASPAALMHAILHQDPAPPSCVRDAVAGADADLDAICLKALRKRPAERYGSAGALLEDLQRWLAHEPVEARRGERGYRLRRRLRRRWPLLAAALAAAALLAGATFYEVRRTRAELTAVALERDKARSIAHFFEALFAAATPAEVREGIAARELLRRSAERLEQGTTAVMADDARAALFSTAAGVMAKQDLLPEAARMFERAIELWRKAPQAPASDLAAAMHERARIAYIQGEPERALDWQQRAVALLRADPAGDRATLAALLNALAVMQWTSGQADAALRSLEEAKRLLRDLLPEGRTYYANTLRNLAMFQLYAGDAEAALANAREGVAQHDLQRPVRERERLGVQVTVAASLRELGRFAEAEALYRDTLGTLQARGENSMDRVEALNSYAKLLLLLQRWDEAEATLREIEAIHVANGGPRHARALAARADLALVAIGRERWSEAEAALAEVLRQRPDAGGIEASTLAAERVSHAYATCRAAARPSPQQAGTLREAVYAMRRDPPLPRRRLEEAQEWLRWCEAAAAAPRPG